MNRFAVVAAAIVVMGILTVTLFSYISGGEKNEPQAIPQSEALGMPAAVSLIYTNPEKNHNRFDGSYVVIHEDVVFSRIQCTFCTVIEFRSGPASEVEVSWSADREFIITDAKKVTFFAMGEQGGEEVRFKAAGKKVDSILNGRLVEILDFDIATRPVTLTDEWQKFEVDLSGADLRGITNPFGIEVERGQHAVIFLKGLTLEAQAPEEPLEVEENEND